MTVVDMQGNEVKDAQQAITPDQDLVSHLEHLLEMAKSGELRSFNGVGVRLDRRVVFLTHYGFGSYYEMLWALDALHEEYKAGTLHRIRPPRDDLSN